MVFARSSGRHFWTFIRTASSSKMVRIFRFYTLRLDYIVLASFNTVTSFPPYDAFFPKLSASRWTAEHSQLDSHGLVCIIVVIKTRLRDTLIVPVRREIRINGIAFLFFTRFPVPLPPEGGRVTRLKLRPFWKNRNRRTTDFNFWRTG